MTAAIVAKSIVTEKEVDANIPSLQPAAAGMQQLNKSATAQMNSIEQLVASNRA